MSNYNTDEQSFLRLSRARRKGERATPDKIQGA